LNPQTLDFSAQENQLAGRFSEMFNAERPRAMRLHRASELSVAGWPSSR
jgi:hypothetical protein